MDPYNTADALNPRRQPAATPAATSMPANPYAAPYARVAEARETTVDTTPASRLSRLLARLADTAVVAGPLIVVAVVAYQAYARALRSGSNAHDVFSGMSGMLIAAALWAGIVSIYQWVLLYRSGQTLGKKWMGVRIVRTDGSRASLGRIIVLRGIALGLFGLIPYVGRFIGLVDALFIFRADKRCIHDLFADTIVVDA